MICKVKLALDKQGNGECEHADVSGHLNKNCVNGCLYYEKCEDLMLDAMAVRNELYGGQDE